MTDDLTPEDDEVPQPEDDPVPEDSEAETAAGIEPDGR